MSEFVEVFKNVLTIEAKAIERAKDKISKEQLDKFLNLCSLLPKAQLIFIGVGKSAAIGKKMAATFSSLGVNSFFLHPVEALHGDMGRIRQGDIIVLISKSGTTEEVIKLLSFLSIEKSHTIGLLGNLTTELAQYCGLIFDCSVEKEACINNQAPTTSTTLTLAIGDALAVVYEKSIGLTKEGFAENHPAGALGKSLRLKVQNLMHHRDSSPWVQESASLKDVVLAMSQFPLGACAVIDEQDKLKGIIVEGDFRRSLAKDGISLETSVLDIMNDKPLITTADELAYDVLYKMECLDRQVYVLPVVEQDTFKGFIRMHDIMREGLYANK